MPKTSKFGRLNTKRLLEHSLAITAIGRHSLYGNNWIGLSKNGIEKARWSGRNLPQGFKVSARAGEVPRQKNTARIMVNAYPGLKEKKVVIAPELGFKWIKDMLALEKLEKKYGEKQVLADYLSEKLPTSIIENPKIVGEAVLLAAINATTALAKATAERPFVLNVASNAVGAVVLKALGIDYYSIKPKNFRSKNPPLQGDRLKETEAVLFFHLPDGRIILSFRGQKRDVTMQIKRIIGKES